jgi:hypothetical protein
LLATLGRTAVPDSYSPALPAADNIQIQQNAKDPGTADLVDRMNAYRMQVDLANSIEALQNRYNNRVRWEMHLGAGTAFAPAPGGPVKGVGVYDSAGNYSFFALGLKANLNNLKLPRPENLLGEVTRLRTLLGVHKYDSTESLLAECDRIEAGTKKYMNDFWFKRWSVSVNFPFLYRSALGSSYYYSSSGSGYYIYENRYTNNDPYPNFDWSNTTFTLGCDLGDFVTLQAGLSARNHISFTLSTDISTPVSLVATDFYALLRGFSGTGTSRGLFYY